MKPRSRIGGRHFALMKLLISGEPGADSPEMRELCKWGFVVRDGENYGPSNAGRIYWDTIENMKVPE